MQAQRVREERREKGRAFLSQYNREHASARMKANNPMRHERVRAAVSAKLKQMGHKPIVRGGNGRPPSKPQRLLAEALRWPMEYVVPTRTTKSSGYPSCYKIDIADPSRQVAIEVDGRSHNTLARHAQDRKKEVFLQSIGWRVLRFTNEEVMADLSGCVQKVLSTI
jgi:hypothetical protein